MLYNNGIKDNYLAIQQMLNKRGTVIIDKPGTYLVSKTLKIYSSTRLVLAPGVIIKAAPMSKCALIENEHFACGGRDSDIEIIGGTFDGNCDKMGLNGEYEALHRLDTPYSPQNFKGKLMRFAHVDKIVIEKLTVKNPVSYGIQIGDVRGFIARDLFFDYNWHFGTTDGVHINGPARDGVIENLCGTTNDDMVALTTYDEAHAEISKGDIENVSIRNISAKNGFSGVRLLSGENFALKNVRVDGVYGDYRHSGIVVSNHCKREGKVWFDNLIIENFFASKSHTPLTDDCFTYWEKGADTVPIIHFERGACCGNVIIRNVFRHQEKSTEGLLVSMTEDTSVERLVLENIYQTTAEGAMAPFCKIDARIGELIKK